MELKIEGVSYRPSVPITVSRTLDESLDAAHLVIPYTTRREPFIPFTFAELDGERWLVGADIPTEVKGLRGKWRHEVTLVEETKRMETLFVSSKVITKHDYRDYLSELRKTEYEKKVYWWDPNDYDETILEGIKPNIPNSMVTPSQKIPSSMMVRAQGLYTETELSYFQYAKDQFSTEYVSWAEIGGTVIASTDDPLAELDPGTSLIVGNTITVHHLVVQSVDTLCYEITYDITFVIEPSRTTNKTAEDVVVELIADAEQLRYGDTPRIRLDDDTAARLRAIEAPEDAFTAGMSLYEALLKVGDWDGVCGIPRLQRDVLTFDRWGSTETVKISGRVISASQSTTAEEYCSSLESAAENMVDDSANGRTVTDPFISGWQTVRTEDGAVVIEDGTIRISTALPIWQVVKLELGYVGGKINALGGDLTPYVYERSEYELLSEYAKEGTGFPGSRAYALYYTKGSSGIDGLSFVPRTLSGDLGWMQYNAIERILDVKFGKKSKLSSDDIVNLPFRVTYIPFISARVRQHKMRADGVEALMPYGQGGSVVSARTYGGHLRARAQMLGLPEQTIQVIYGKADKLPIPGQRVDEINYIGSVTAEHYPTYRKCELVMSPNYNRINRFIEVKRDIRQFEIPMDGSTERNILSEDFIVIGDYEGRFGAMTSPAVEEAVVKAIMGLGTAVEIGAVICATGNQPNKTDGVQVILPMAGMPIGNSVLFYTRYKDNYSAGKVSSYNYNLTGERRLQRDIRYTDVYGGAEYLHMDLVTGAAVGNGADDIDTAHTVPLTSGVEVGRSMISTEDRPILLSKDARESISLSYQIHYVSNRDLIIGEALAARAPYLSYKDYAPAEVYIYHSYINPLTGESVERDGIGYALSYGKQWNVWYLQMPTVPAHTAWAVKQDGAFLFGANSQMPDRLYFNFRDKLREVGEAEDEDEGEQVFITYNVVNATHINVVDYITKGKTLHDSFKANSGHALPNSITVKMGGVTLPASAYTWNKTTSTSATLTVPDVSDDLEIAVIATDNSFNVVIEFEYWDSYENDLLDSEKLTGVYPYGYSIQIPATIDREYNGETRTFELNRDAVTIVVTEDINTSYVYKLKD